MVRKQLKPMSNDDRPEILTYDMVSYDKGIIMTKISIGSVSINPLKDFGCLGGNCNNG